MKILDKKVLHKSEWKKFQTWIGSKEIIFGDNFYTHFICINKEKDFEKNLIEFYLYNRFELKNRYLLEWPKWLTSIEGKTINEWLSNLFNEFFQEDKDVFGVLIKFLFDLEIYLKKQGKNIDTEYELLKKYWVFIKKLRDTKNIDYNNWIQFINKNIHIELKGFKE